MKKQIRLSKSNDKRYWGYFEYLVAYDYASGNSNRYEVLVLNVDDPVTIGRELTLSAVRNLIKDYEKEAAKLTDYIGSRDDVLKTMYYVSRHRFLNKTE